MSPVNNKPQYSKEFKKEAVDLALNGSISIVQTAKDLGLKTNTLYNWITEHRKALNIQSPASLNRTPEQQELINLKKDNARLRQECEILKKATAYFAREAQ